MTSRKAKIQILLVWAAILAAFLAAALWCAETGG